MKILKLLLPTLLIIGIAFSNAAYAQTEKKASDVEPLLKISKGLSKLINAPKTKTAPDPGAAEADAADDYSNAPLPFPVNCGAFLRVSSLNNLDQGARKFFQKTSDVDFSVLSTLRLTDYRKVLAAVDTNAELAMTAFCESAPPKFALVLPVRERNFPAFIEALAQTTPEKDRSFSIGSDRKTANLSLVLGEPFVVVARQINPNYVVLVLAQDARILDEFEPSRLAALTDEAAPSLVEPVLTFETTVRGLEQLTREGRPFWREVTEILTQLETTLANMEVAANITEIREYVRQNLGKVRVDATIDEYGVYVSTQTLPRPRSQAEKIRRSYQNLSVLNASADRFFVVLPDVEAPIAGQTEIPKELANTLPSPFNRVRFVEYSLNLPLETELPAESWLFYLEVDDADEFVKEMIIPKAREIGSYVGSKQAEDVASQLFGAIAERRLDRQSRRSRPPRSYADPEAAAARGATLGSLLGSAIGADSGEQMAMKAHKFDDYTMYIGDLETYARQKSLMRAEAQGYAPYAEPTLLFDRNRPLLSALDVLMMNVQNGDSLQSALLSSANARAELVDNSPLFARTSKIIVLDKQHVLVGLGNETLLHYAVNNWKSLRNPRIRYLSLRRDRESIVALRNLIQQIPDLDNSYLTSAIRLDLASGQAYYQWIADYYLPNAPKLNVNEFPDDMSKPLVVSTVGVNNECTRVVASHKMIADVFKTFSGGADPLQLILQPKANTTAEPGAAEDLDSVFK
jgi:hypothetical protein